MRRKLVVMVGAMALSVGTVIGGTGIAFASTPNHALPGTPGTPSCGGQTNVYLAQLLKNYNLPGYDGIGNVARLVGVSVPQLEAIVGEYCAS